MLHHGHQLDVREAEFGHVVGERGRQLAVSEPAIALLRHAPPRAEVNFVDRNRRAQHVARRPCRHPLLVLEAEARAINDRRGRRRHLQRSRPRIGLEVRRALARTNFILVARAGLETRDEQFPDSRPAHRTHHVDAAVPCIEVADHAEAARVGRPDRERHARDAAQLARMRAEHLVGPLVLELAEQVEVEVADRWQEAVRIASRCRSAAAKTLFRAGRRTARGVLSAEFRRFPPDERAPSRARSPRRRSSNATRSASGRNTRTTTPSGSTCAPRMECGSRCSSATRRSRPSAAS